jgi:DNA-binding response OmpR family regulator
MRNQQELTSDEIEGATVLSISPNEEDHVSLQSIVGRARALFKADGLPAALTALQQHELSVVVCERDLPAGSWLDVLTYLYDLPHPPSLIVTSRSADDRLWAEALNLGAWDVLAKPFDRIEVLRSIRAAWKQWRDRAEVPLRTLKMAS